MACRAAALALLLSLALVIGGPAVSVAADGAASDITLKDVSVSVLEASGSASSTHQVSSPTAGLKVVVLDHTRTVKVAFGAALAGSSEDFRPQQAFLRLTSRDSGAAAFFAAVRAKDGSMYATAKSADVQKQIGVQSGAYDAVLLVGDTRSAQPLSWALGEVQVLYPPLDDGSQPAAAPSRVMDSLFKPLPVITHMHRQPERRTPGVVSLAFALLVAAPLLAFVAAALRAGANFKAFPTSGGGFLAAAGFHSGLALICTLYLLFWIKLNLMQTLPILAVLAAVIAVFGSSLPGHLGAARQKQE